MQYKFHVSVLNSDQFDIVTGYDNDEISRIYVSSYIALHSPECLRKIENKKIYLSLPFVLRDKYVSTFERILNVFDFDGFLIRNNEEFSYINSIFGDDHTKAVALDCGMYILNSDALCFYAENSRIKISDFYNSYELNQKEQCLLDEAIKEKCKMDIASSNVIYGRIPMMISANCIKKTVGCCDGAAGFNDLKDRTDKYSPVWSDCDFCTNIIYNSVPLSLHRYFGFISQKGNMRLDFTNENKAQVKNVIDFFVSGCDRDEKAPDYEYTNGHFNRKVE